MRTHTKATELNASSVFTRASASWLIQETTYQQELDELLKEEPATKPTWELAALTAQRVTAFYSRVKSLAPMRGWLADHFNVEETDITIIEH